MNTFKYKNLVSRWRETTELTPQTVGPLTGLYKQVTHRLKIMPIPTLILLSCILVCGVVFLLGPSIASLVSLLQRGF